MMVPLDIQEIRTLALDEIQALTALHPDIALLLYQAGESLLRETDASNDIFIVLRGSYVVEQNGSDMALDETECDVETFSIVGEMACLGGQMRTATVRVKTECHALRLSPVHLETVIARFPNLTRMICRQFAIRLKAADEALCRLRATQASASPQPAAEEPSETETPVVPDHG